MLDRNFSLYKGNVVHIPLSTCTEREKWEPRAEMVIGLLKLYNNRIGNCSRKEGREEREMVPGEAGTPEISHIV